MWRVMQITETGEEFCVYDGSEDGCYAWINNNEGNYPESRFYVEPINAYQTY